jgi:hypothetical protein
VGRRVLRWRRVLQLYGIGQVRVCSNHPDRARDPRALSKCSRNRQGPTDLIGTIMATGGRESHSSPIRRPASRERTRSPLCCSSTSGHPSANRLPRSSGEPAIATAGISRYEDIRGAANAPRTTGAIVARGPADHQCPCGSQGVVGAASLRWPNLWEGCSRIAEHRKGIGSPYHPKREWSADHRRRTRGHSSSVPGTKVLRTRVGRAAGRRMADECALLSPSSC